jgi:hypothetical protein
MQLDSDHRVQLAASANRCGDAVQCAFDVAALSMLIIGDDQQSRTALALFFVRLAQKLDGDVVDAVRMN